MPTLAITAIGADRPGIVASVTKVLFELGCNLEDTAMSILRGQFAIVMVVDAPEGMTAADLDRALAEPTASFDLVTAVRELHAAPAGGAGEGDGYGERWTVVVYGRDHPGIVHLVAARLAALDVNIIDVTTRMSGEAEALYSMVMEVRLPGGLAAADVQAALGEVADSESLTVRLHPADADIL